MIFVIGQSVGCATVTSSPGYCDKALAPFEWRSVDEINATQERQFRYIEASGDIYRALCP